jgi:hypothetical protein
MKLRTLAPLAAIGLLAAPVYAATPAKAPAKHAKVQPKKPAKKAAASTAAAKK